MDYRNICFYTTKSKKINTIPSCLFTSEEEYYEELFQADLESVNNQELDFIKFDGLVSFEEIKIMEKLVAQLGDQTTALEL